MSKIALTDVETTGLDPSVHGIVEIACRIFDNHTFEVEKEFSYKIMPEPGYVMDPKAQAVNGFSEAEWKREGAVTLRVAMLNYTEKTKDCVFMAFNAPFDLGFLEAACKKTNLKMTTRWYPICLRAIAWFAMPHTGMFKWSMKEVCQKLGVPPEPDEHRAMNGVIAEFEIYKLLAQKHD